MLRILLIGILFAVMTAISSALPTFPTPHKPALRDELLLSGTWEDGKVVPVYEGIKDFDQDTFERRVTVPANWKGKILKLEFKAVNFVADIFVNDQPVAHHVGGWMPFAVDVTRWTTPGTEFTLKVAVKGPKHPPITNASGSIQWPVGAWSSKGGIADDVYLRAYGPVYIEDTFIRTSFREKSLTADYTLVNTDNKTRTVTVGSEATPSEDSSATGKLTVTPARVTLQSGERKVVTIRTKWQNPSLWWPDSPALYNLRSTVIENGTILDTETRRFGFRELWAEGNQFKLNGLRANLYGDYQSLDAGYHSSSSDLTPAGWPATVDKIKAMNIRVLRFHHSPMAEYLYDVADEKGLLICSEASNYAREYLMKSDKDDYIRNSVTAVAPWIRSLRNHPSIYIWNATNEMTYPHLGSFSPDQCLQVGKAIQALDPTRFVGYDGDTKPGGKGVKGALVNYHYPEGYNNEPKGSIYSWADLVDPAKPTGTGEMLHTRDGQHPEKKETVERNQWWLGIWLRGLRYTNWTDVRPSCYWFAAKDLENPDPLARVRGENLRNALAPIALFDKAYDDLGITPYVTGLTPGGTLPTLTAGAVAQRTLVLYNDDFHDTRVEIEVLIRGNGQEWARVSKTMDVPLGRHVEIPLTFAVPASEKSGALELVLRTSKKGTPRFEEIRRFTVTGTSPAINGKERGVNIGTASLVP